MVRRDELLKRFGNGSDGVTATVTLHPLTKDKQEKREKREILVALVSPVSLVFFIDAARQ